MFGWLKRKSDLDDGRKPAPVDQKPATPTVKFDPTDVTDSVRGDLRRNIEALAEIGSDRRDLVYEAALRSVTGGRALNILFDALVSEGVEKKRAGDISRLLNNKATALIQRERQMKLGIRYATWCYSGAPCGSKKQSAGHRAADGKRYLLSEGLLVGGKRTWPGCEDNCKCFAKPVIPNVDVE